MNHKFRCYGKFVTGTGREWMYHEYISLTRSTVMKRYGVVLLNDQFPDFVEMGINIEKNDTLRRLYETAAAQPVTLRELGQILTVELR